MGTSDCEVTIYRNFKSLLSTSIFQVMECLVQDCKEAQDFENFLKMVSLSEFGKFDLTECLIALTDTFMRAIGYTNDKYLWLYSLPFIHFFGGKKTSEWVPKSLGFAQYNIASEKMIHLLRIDQHFSHAFLRNTEFQFIAKKIVDKSNFIYNIDLFMLLEKMMKGMYF